MPPASAPPARCGPQPGIARSRASRWRGLVLLGVHVFMVAHFVHWRLAGRTLSPLEPSEAMEFSKNGIVNAGLLFFAAMIVSTVVFGRWFCGWGCHLIALQDGSRWLLRKLGIRPRPLRSRALAVVPAIAFAYMFLWPLAYRLMHGLGVRYQGSHLVTEGFWETFPPPLVGALTFLFAGGVIVYFLGAKGFCTYACPYGAILGAVDHLAPGRIRVTDACEGCGHCTAVCSSNVLVHREVHDYGAVVDPGCMKCMDCVSVCPNDALYFGFGRPGLLTRARVAAPVSRWRARRWRELSLGEEALAALAFVAVFVTFRGLYGSVPFLFALALGAIAGGLALLAWRLVRRSNVNLNQRPLKRNGRLTGAGVWTCGGLFLAAAFTGHSALVQRHAAAVDRAWEASEPLRSAWFDAPGRALADADRKLVEAGLDQALALERRGLLHDPRLGARIASFRLLLGDEGGFVARLEQAVREERDPAPAWLGLADYRAARMDVAGAFEAYGRAIEADPDRAVARERMAGFAARIGALPRAAGALERALAAHPGHAGMLYDLGVLAALTGQDSLALARFREALEADPEHVPARENLAAGLLALGRLDEALEQLEALLARVPENAEARFQAAQVAISLGRLEAAEGLLLELCRQQPGLAPAWELLAQVALRLGQPERAAGYRARAQASGQAGGGGSGS